MTVLKQRLRDLLFKAGICPDCESEIQHYVTEPFAVCKCGTMEWTYREPLIDSLRRKIVELEFDIERMKEENA